METNYRNSSKVYIKNSRYDTANIKMYMLSEQDTSFDWSHLWWWNENPYFLEADKYPLSLNISSRSELQ